MGCLFSGVFSILGFIFGFIILGGLGGAILGALFGGIIDSIIAKSRINKTTHYYQNHEYDFTEHELHLAAYVAKADQNRLLRSEMTYVQEYLRKQVGSARLNTVMLRFRDILNSEIDIKTVCADINRHASINEKLVILHFLFGFSNADGEMRTEEVNAIWEIAQLLGVSRTTFEAVKSMFTASSYGYGGYNYGGYGYGQGGYSQGGYTGGSSSGSYTSKATLENDYKILEVSPDATDDEVKKAYRAAAKKHHPDKVSHLGEDVRKAAEEKFAKVNEAYERIKKSRGMN